MGSILSYESGPSRVLFFLFSTAFLIAFIMNTVYYNKIRGGAPGSCAQISKSTANGLYWFNLILAIIAAFMWIVTLVRLFYKPGGEKELITKAREQATTAQKQVASAYERAQTQAAEAYQRFLLGQFGAGYTPAGAPLPVPAYTVAPNPAVGPAIS